MEGLVKRKLLDKSLIIIVGDHGEAFGTHNQTGHAGGIYNENLNIPCLLYSPSLFKGNVNNRIAGLIDIAPTVMSLLDMKIPDEWQGQNLLQPPNDEDRTFFISPFSDFLFGSRYKNWKYIYNANQNRSELYDLSIDPQELNNVAATNSKVVKSEYEYLAGWVQYHNQCLRFWDHQHLLNKKN